MWSYPCVTYEKYIRLFLDDTWNQSQIKGFVNYEVSCICVCAYMHVCEEDYTLFSDKKPENPYLLHNFMSKGQ